MDQELRLKKIIRFGAAMLLNQIITKSFFGMYRAVYKRMYRKAKCKYIVVIQDILQNCLKLLAIYIRLLH